MYDNSSLAYGSSQAGRGSNRWIGDHLPSSTSSSSSSTSKTTQSSKTLSTTRGGRWTDEEHQRFLDGFLLHGHRWKRVQYVVKTRTVTQVRTHAQKFLLKQKRLGQNQGTTSGTTGAPMDVDDEYHQNRNSEMRTTRERDESLITNIKSEPDHELIAEAAITLCRLMENNNNAVPVAPPATAAAEPNPNSPGSDEIQRKQYLCRKCGIPKKGHVCNKEISGSSSTDESSSSISPQRNPTASSFNTHESPPLLASPVQPEPEMDVSPMKNIHQHSYNESPASSLCTTTKTTEHHEAQRILRYIQASNTWCRGTLRTKQDEAGKEKMLVSYAEDEAEPRAAETFTPNEGETCLARLKDLDSSSSIMVRKNGMKWPVRAYEPMNPELVQDEHVLVEYFGHHQVEWIPQVCTN